MVYNISETQLYVNKVVGVCENYNHEYCIKQEKTGEQFFLFCGATSFMRPPPHLI